MASSVQSFDGKLPELLVSSKLIRVLFSFSRIVSAPKVSLVEQSRPTQRLPWTITSSANTCEARAPPAVRQRALTPSARLPIAVFISRVMLRYSLKLCFSLKSLFDRFADLVGRHDRPAVDDELAGHVERYRFGGLRRISRPLLTSLSTGRVSAVAAVRS